MATMMWHLRVNMRQEHEFRQCLETYAAIRKAPDTSTGLRPTLSIQITAGMVDRNVLCRIKQGTTTGRGLNLRDTHNAGGKEGKGISSKTQRLEDGRCIVKNGVDTSYAILSVCVFMLPGRYQLTPLLKKHGPDSHISVNIFG